MAAHPQAPEPHRVVGSGPGAVPGPGRRPQHPTDRRDPVHRPPGPDAIGFNLFGVDPQVKVWSAARHLPQHLQVPVAAAFIAAGALAIWVAVTIQRKPIGAQ